MTYTIQCMSRKYTHNICQFVRCIATEIFCFYCSEVIVMTVQASEFVNANLFQRLRGFALLNEDIIGQVTYGRIADYICHKYNSSHLAEFKVFLLRVTISFQF